MSSTPARRAGAFHLAADASVAAGRFPPPVYVAVGASETVGIGSDDPLNDAWPQVLLRRSLPPGTCLFNLGIPGATVEEAIAAELPQALRHRPDIVTVWLNVNDLVAGVPAEVYERQLRSLVAPLRRHGNATVLLANTPPLDWLPAYLMVLALAPPPGVTDAGEQWSVPSPDEVTSAVASYNEAIARVAEDEGLVLVDLHAAVSRARAEGLEATLVSADGFHPSSAGHAAAAEVFAAAARATGWTGSTGSTGLAGSTG